MRKGGGWLAVLGPEEDAGAESAAAAAPAAARRDDVRVASISYRQALQLQRASNKVYEHLCKRRGELSIKNQRSNVNARVMMLFFAGRS